MTLYIGIDGGGSHCRALLQDSKGKILGEGWGGPANPVNDAELAKQSILEACNQALAIDAARASLVSFVSFA